MIEGIITGYEARFDFPEREGLPDLPYLLASVPRSGSTYVSHLLWASGCLGAPLEYLNFEPGGPYGAADGDPAAQNLLWQGVLARRTSPNGVFGLKAFPLQLEAAQQQNPMLMGDVMRLMLGKGSAAKVVRLRRRDRDAHAISYARAILSGIWRREQEVQEKRPEPEYSAKAMGHAARLIAEQEAGWDAMISELEILPLELWFEDVLEAPENTVMRVADYLGVGIDPGAAIEVPQIQQQSREGAKAWAQAHSGN